MKTWQAIAVALAFTAGCYQSTTRTVQRGDAEPLDGEVDASFLLDGGDGGDGGVEDAALDGALDRDAEMPDGALVDVGVRDASLADADAGALDAGALDAGALDAGALDAGALDAGAPDASAPDVGAPDASARDAGGAPDASARDAGARDAGVLDAGALDAGALDAGARDAGARDSGALDAGALDAGARDVGASDSDVSDGLSDAAIAQVLRAVHRGEIVLASLALVRAEDPAVRGYAEALIEEHLESSGAVSDWLDETGTEAESSALSESLIEESDRTLEALAAAPSFDRSFVRAEVVRHRAAAELLEALLEEVADPQLATIIVATRALEAEHLRRARLLQATIGF